MLLLSICCLVGAVFGIETKLEKYAKSLSPETIIERDHVSRKYPKFRMEVTMTFGMNEETIRFIEAVIENHFSGNIRDSKGVKEMTEIVEIMLGGYWAVYFFDDPFMFATTAFRRSVSFVVLDVNGMGIAVVKEFP